MAELNASIEIAAPVERVFDYVDAWEHTTGFVRGMSAYSPLDPGRTSGVGARFAVTMAAGPVKVNGEMEIVEHERPTRIAFTGTKPFRTRSEWTFVPSGDGTHVELRSSVDLPGGLTGLPIRKAFGAFGQSNIEGSLVDLKRLVEADG